MVRNHDNLTLSHRASSQRVIEQNSHQQFLQVSNVLKFCRIYLTKNVKNNFCGFLANVSEFLVKRRLKFYVVFEELLAINVLIETDIKYEIAWVTDQSQTD